MTTEQFWTKVEPEPNSGCLLWTGALTPRKYGMCLVLGKIQSAHRAVWQMTKGPIPADLHVLHRCDVRTCVNVSHLFLGTNADNVADRHLKGRTKFDPMAGTLAIQARPVCRNGHAYEGTQSTHGHRICRACQRDRNRRNRQRAA